MSIQTRQPAGTPVGGHFATSARVESGTSLIGPGHDPEPGPADAHPSERSPEHAVLSELGVGAGKLSLLAPVEAKTLVAGVRERGIDQDRPRVRAYVDSYLRWRDLAETGPVHETRARRIVDEATRQYAAAKVGFRVSQEAVKREDAGADLLSEEAQEDLSAAVRRFDDARADLQYVTDPEWRASVVTETLAMNDYFALDGARRRFAKKDYRGRVF